jgi:fatty acid synthase subunit beta
MLRVAFKDTHSRNLVQPDAALAGHSLGEFSALASVADILPNSSLIDIVFYRGLTMQRVVERPLEQVMCAVNPSASARRSMMQTFVRLSMPSRMPGTVS